MSNPRPTVAIDGPGGSGKSTVARAVAEALGVDWLDTGAMYRAVTLLALERGEALDDDERLGLLATAMRLEVNGRRVTLDGDDVSDAIRSDAVNAAVSTVAAQPSVRRELVARQQAWVRAHGGGILEGRDIGSVVLPDADVKVYLTASAEERAKRRTLEESPDGPAEDAVEATRHSIEGRDRLDSSRADSPLTVVEGAHVIDSTGHSAEEVARQIGDLVAKARSASRPALVPTEIGTDTADPDTADPDNADRDNADRDNADRDAADATDATGTTDAAGATSDAGDEGTAGQRLAIADTAERSAAEAEVEPTSGDEDKLLGFSFADRILYGVCRFFSVGLSRLLFPGVVIGLENLPRRGAYVIAPVHRSNIDWLIVARISKRRLHFLAKAEIWTYPRVGRFIEHLGALPVNREVTDRDSFNKTLQVLAGNEPLVLFPEGTRRDGAKVGEIREGAAYLALRAGVPLVPIGLAGTENVLPRGTRVPRPARVRIVIGTPISTANLGGGRRVPRARVHAITEELRDGIQLATDNARALLGSKVLTD